MEFNSYEYSAEQKAEGRWKTYKILLITLYTLYALAFFIAICITRVFVLGALIPVTLWIIVFFTWKYSKPDYKYTIETGVMTFYTIYGRKAKKPTLSFHVKDAMLIAPRDESADKISELHPKHSYSAIPYAACPDIYVAIFKDETGNICSFYFRATAQALKLLSFYNRSATRVTKTEL